MTPFNRVAGSAHLYPARRQSVRSPATFSGGAVAPGVIAPGLIAAIPPAPIPDRPIARAGAVPG